MGIWSHQSSATPMCSAMSLIDKGSDGTVGYTHAPKSIAQFTIWLFNIAMENDTFIDDFPIKTVNFHNSLCLRDFSAPKVAQSVWNIDLGSKCTVCVQETFCSKSGCGNSAWGVLEGCVSQ